jgi:hypothetical protein
MPRKKRTSKTKLKLKHSQSRALKQANAIQRMKKVHVKKEEIQIDNEITLTIHALFGVPEILTVHRDDLISSAMIRFMQQNKTFKQTGGIPPSDEQELEWIRRWNWNGAPLTRTRRFRDYNMGKEATIYNIFALGPSSIRYD